MTMFIFTLYPTQSSVDRCKLILKHPIPIKTLPVATFRRILETLHIEWRNSTPPHYQSREMRILNISYPRMGIESTTSCPRATTTVT